MSRSDQDLKHDVSNELRWEPSVHEAHIGVSAKGGVVTLSGHVPSYAEKHGAEKAAKRVFGVKAVANELDVKLNGAEQSDEDLARSCVRSLEANALVPDAKIKVIVDQHWVTLEGLVDWQYERTAAENAIRYLVGVRGITNRIAIAARATVASVKEKIEAAFKRSADIDSKRIQVEAKEGKVILKGNVRSWAERTEAQHAAWAAPGVTAVQNDLIIQP